MRKLILGLGLFLIAFGLRAQEVTKIEVKPVGVYAEINIDGQNRMMKQLYDPKTRNSAVDSVFNNLWNYNPPVLYVFSQALFLNGEKNSAIEWYLYAQLNAMYDAARCADNSAKQAVLILEENVMPMFGDYLKQNKTMEKNSAEKALALFDKLQPNYDIRWINLHGVGAFMGVFNEEAPKETPKLTEDKVLWPMLKSNVIKEFTASHGLKEK